MPHAPYRTEFGTGWVEFDESAILRIHLPTQRGAASFAAAEPTVAAARLITALEAYFDGRASFLPHSKLTESVGGSELTRAIYLVASGILPGETRTYGEVATAVGRPGAARVVGAAMAANPLAPVIPCHRVVGADGGLRGYRGGLAMKRALLDMESAGVTTLDWKEAANA